MILSTNLCANGRFAPAGGLPVTLSKANATVMDGVLPKGAAGLSVTVKASTGVTPTGTAGSDPTENAPTTASVYLAIYAAPTTVGGSDGLQVGDTVSVTGLSVTEQTLEIETPSATTDTPAVYVWRLWVDTLGTNGVEVSDLVML